KSFSRKIRMRNFARRRNEDMNFRESDDMRSRCFSEVDLGQADSRKLSNCRLSGEKSQTTDSLIPPRLKNRRNSRSLPASPQTSPKVFRKNPFFANIFFGEFLGTNHQ
ncbi:unnamed protein product, partial [Nesidiocoris tenuis]